MKRSPVTLLVPTAFVLALAFAPAANAQATAKVACKDGTTSAASARGACSGHGGVAAAAATKMAEKSTTKAEKAADKTATKSEKAADKATAKSEKAADKAAAKSEKAADKAAAKSEKAADKADKGAESAAAKTTAVSATAEVTAKCKDGTTSKSKTRRGACSGHGGVASWGK